MAQRLAKAAPANFRQRAVSAYAELTQLVGWLCFNMGDYRSAQHYYDDAVRAYVADNQPDKCRETLDREYAALEEARTGEPAAAWWYFYDESFYWGTESECSLKLRRPDAAIDALDKSLTLVDPANLHNYSFGLLSAQRRASSKRRSRKPAV